MSFFLLFFAGRSSHSGAIVFLDPKGHQGKGPFSSLMFLQATPPRLTQESVGTHPPSLAALPCLDSFGHGFRTSLLPMTSKWNWMPMSRCTLPFGGHEREHAA